MRAIRNYMIILVTLIVLLGVISTPSLANSGKDNRIQQLVDRGYVKGYTDGSLGVDNLITRAEFATVVVNVMGLEGNVESIRSNKEFSDVKESDWYSGYVGLAKKNHLIDGYPDRTFRPNENVTYAEAVTIMVRMLLTEEVDLKLKKASNWPQSYILKALELGILSESEKMKESQAINRGDVFSILSNVVNVREGKPIIPISTVEPIPSKDKQKEDVSNIVIVIDAGHGGSDPGATTKNGDREKEINLDVSKRVEAILKSYGYTVRMTRATDEALKLSNRSKLANDINADLFVSIHSNSAVNTKAHGIETLYSPRKTGAHTFAKTVHLGLKEETGMFDRGLKERTNLSVLNGTRMPAVLVELGFMSNSQDMTKLRQDSFRQACAVGIAKGIKNHVSATLQ